MISVCIVEDNQSCNADLLTYLNKLADIKVVYTGVPSNDFQELIKALPEVVIMDVSTKRDFRDVDIRRLKTALPAVQVIVITAFEDEEKLFQLLKAGALGYLLKNDSPEKIAEAVRMVHRGEGVMNGLIARKILDYFQLPAKTVPRFDDYNLTVREKEIMLLLMDGLSYKEIAAKCFVSIDTVNSHIRKIYTKLNVQSRAEISARFR